MANRGKGKTAAKDASTKSILLILIGLPGSGKSTTALELEKAGWLRVNQDELGSADECKKLLDKGFKHNQNVVLDRCNSMQKERKMFISESKNKFGLSRVECLFLDIPPDVCKQRIRERKKHPTLAGPEGDAVVDDFVKRFNKPEKWEGFDKMMVVTNPEELGVLIKEIKQYPNNYKK